MHLEYLWNLVSKNWQTLSKEEAAQSPYYGLRGWLLLFYGLAAVGTVMNVMDVISPTHQVYVSTYGDRPNLIRALLLAFAVAQIPFLVLAPLRHRLTPKVWLAGIWIPMAAYAAAIDMPGQADAMILRLALSFGAAALMTWYVLHSKRVNVTFLHRVPAEEVSAEHPSLGSAASASGKIPKPAIYQRAQRSNRIFWGLAILLGVAIVIILLTQ